MNLRLLLLLITTSFVSILNAQEQNFIEVQVWDTMQITAETIEYSVFLSNTDEEEIYRSKEKPTLEADELEALIREQGVAYHKVKNTNYSVNSSYDLNLMQPFILEFKKQADLEKFHKAIKDYSNVLAHITNLHNNNITYYEKEIDKQLLDKSKKKATHLAKLIDRKIGKIIQITSELDQGELTTDWDMQFTTAWVAYPAVTNFSHLFSSQSMPKILIARGFTIRYEME